MIDKSIPTPYANARVLDYTYSNCLPFHLLTLASHVSILAVTATRTPLHGLGRQTFDSMVYSCTVWGDNPHDLGRQGARFGETPRTAWGYGPHGLERRVARFRETMRPDFSSKISDLTVADKYTLGQ